MLVPCPECRRQISDKAPSCPHCGVPLASGPVARIEAPRDGAPSPKISKKKLRRIAIGAAILLSLFLASFVSFVVPTFVPASVSWSSALVCPGGSRLAQRKASMYGGGSYRGGYRVSWVCVARSGEVRGRPSFLFGVIGYGISFLLCLLVVGGIFWAIAKGRRGRR